jgi:hypothetical protein
MTKNSLASKITLFLIIVIIIRIVSNYVLFNKKIDLFEIIFVVLIIIILWIYFKYYEKNIKKTSQSVVTKHPILYLIFMIFIFAIITTLGLIFIDIFKAITISPVLIIIGFVLVLIDILLYLLMRFKHKR